MAQDTPAGLTGKTALITGAAKRIGAVLARRLHAAGMNLALHYRSSAGEAKALADSLQSQRADSVSLIQADLQTAQLTDEIDRTLALMEPQFKGSIEVIKDYRPIPEVRCFPHS